MSEPLRLGIAGLGTVGIGVVKIVQEHAAMLAARAGRPITISAVSARTRRKNRGVDLSAYAWEDDPVALASRDDVDVLVELMGGSDGPAKAAAEAALRAGKDVVTANKAMMALHGQALAVLAEDAGCALRFEAGVAGGIPVVKALTEGLAANRITRIMGVMNGTCNYILTRMEEEEIPFADVLADAQRLGYAEADPTFDIEGNDTAHKLSILTALAFGTRIAADEIYLEGITNITQADILAAGELGYRIKLLGVAQLTDSGIEQRVHPTMVPKESVIAQVGGVTNAVAIETDLLGELLLVGPGAGGDATASAVIGDIADIAKSRPGFQHGPVFGDPARALKPSKKARMRAHEGGYFIRLSALDKVGIFASIARRMAQNGISLESIVQHPTSASEKIKTIVLVTHSTTELAVRKAVEAIVKDGVVADKPQVIRIERAG